MSGMGLIMTIIVGGLAGFVAEKIMKADHGLMMNIGLGIGGAIVLNYLLGAVLNMHFAGLIGQLITAVAGACGLIYGYRMLKARN